MRRYPPPRQFRTDNIKRVYTRGMADRLVTVLGLLRGKSGIWPESDPEAYAAYVRAVLNDPRARRTREERIPPNHPDAALRLDRCAATRLTVACENCRASAVYLVDDLCASFGSDHNIAALPTYLLPCPSKRDRREGACRLRSEPGGYEENVRTVEWARRDVS